METAALASLAGVPVYLGPLLVAVALLFVTMVLTWLVMRHVWVPYQLNMSLKQFDEGLVIISFQNTAAGAALVTAGQARGTLATARTLIDTLRSNLALLLVALALAAVSIVWWFAHAQLLGAWFFVRQCGTREVLDRLVFPVLNLGRLVYASTVWLANFAAELVRFVLFGWWRLLFACTSLATFGRLVRNIGSALADMALAVAQWLADGLFTDGRIAWAAPVQDLLVAVNDTRPTLDCFCAALEPVWDLAIAVPQSTALPVVAECAVNIPARVLQLLVQLVTTLTVPTTGDLTSELQCMLVGLGDFLEDLVQLVIQFIYDLFVLLGSLVASSTPVRTALLDVRRTWQAAAPHHVSYGTATRPLVNLSIARPLRPLSTLWRLAATTSAAPTSVWGGWLFFQNPALPVLLGLDVVLRVAAVPWSRIFTEPVAAVWGAMNVTAMAVVHPTAAFADPSGLRYFQFGHVGDRLRTAADALAQLTVLLDRNLPCSFSVALQAVASVPDGLLEFFIGLFYSLVFPQWLPGEPSPGVLCAPAGNVSCVYPAPPTWAFTDYFAAYYDWPGSRLRRSLALLHSGEECLAYTLGCNTTAPNNNSTSARSNCTEAPLACLARSVTHLLEETANQTLALVLYTGDLFQFSGSKHVFADLAWERWRDAWSDVVRCLAALVELLDVDNDMCLTTTQPESRPQPLSNQTFVREEPVFFLTTEPAPDTYECDSDGRAYYMTERAVKSPPLVAPSLFRGRSVVVRTTNVSTDVTADRVLTCDPHRPRPCPSMSSPYAQVLGNPDAGSGNVTIRLRTAIGSPAFELTFDAASYALVTSEDDLLAQNVTSPGYTANATCNDTTAARISPYPPGLSCWNNQWIYIDPYDTSRSQTRIGSVVRVSDGGNAPIPCAMSLSPFDDAQTSGTWPLHVNEFDPVLGDELLRPVVVQMTANPLYEVPLMVDYSVTPARFIDAACYYGQLVGLGDAQQTVYRNTTVLLPVYYTSALTGRRVPVACDAPLPSDYACQANSSLVPVAGLSNATLFDDFLVLFDPATTVPDTMFIPCEQPAINPLPKCRRYGLVANSVPVELAFEGSDVRITLNFTRPQHLRCDGIFSNASFNAAAAWDDVAPLALQPLWEAMGARVAAEAVRSAGATIYDEPVLDGPALAWLADYEAQAGTALPALYVAGGPASLAQRDRLYRAADNITVFYYYKESFVCYTAAAVRAAGDFGIAFAWEVARTVRSLLTLPADVDKANVDVPTFTDARNNLRAALCDAASAVAYLLPEEFACTDLRDDTGCGSGRRCVANLACDALDVPILLLDIPVAALRTLRAILIPDAPAAEPGDDIFGGTACSAGNPGACVVGFLVYATKKVIFTVTLVARGVAALGDCILCALTKYADPDETCVPVLYAFVDPLADLIDGVGALVITSVLNFIVGLVQMVVYFFSGQFDKFFATLVNVVFATIGDFFGSLAALVLRFFLSLPVIGDLIRFLVTIVRSACDVLSDIITTFGGPDLGCDSISVKRGIAQFESGGYLTPAMESAVAAVWQAGGAAEGACGARMAALNGTDPSLLTADERQELVYCLLAHLWVGPAATPEASTEALTFANECDLLLPALYAANSTWPSLAAPVRARAVPCLEQRWRAEKIRRAVGTWVPHDLAYADSGAWVQLLDDARIAYAAHAEYRADRAAGAPVAVSAAYRADWTARGYDTQHLDLLAALAASEGMAAAQAALDTDNATLALTLAHYVNRTATSPAAARKRALIPGTGVLFARTYRTDRVLGLAETLWQPILGGSNATGNESLARFLVRTGLDAVEARTQTAALSVALTPDLPWRLAAADDGTPAATRLRERVVTGLVDILARDVPAVAVHVARASGLWAPASGLLKRSGELPAAGNTSRALYVWRAVSAGLGYLRDWASGRVASTALWLADPATREALAAAAAADPTVVLPLAASVGVPTNRSGSGVSMAWLSAQWLPTMLPLTQASHVMALAVESSATHSAIGGSVSRRHAVARFGQSVLASVGAMLAAEHPQTMLVPPHLAAVSNVTGLACRTNYTDLCEQCQYLEWAVATVIHATLTAHRFVGPRQSTCDAANGTLPGCNPAVAPSLRNSRAQFDAFNNYTFDDGAWVVLGDSPELPARWPWRDYSSWRLFGDPGPKLRFADIATMASDTWDLLVDTYSESTDAGATNVSVSSGTCFCARACVCVPLSLLIVPLLSQPWQWRPRASVHNWQRRRRSRAPGATRCRCWRRSCRQSCQRALARAPPRRRRRFLAT